MIMTVPELRQYVEADVEDRALEAMLQALELAIRAYTNNNFQVRAFRSVAIANDDSTLLCKGAVPFKSGDTLQITESDLMPGSLVTVAFVDDNVITVNEPLYEESGVVITKVKYPQDVKMGAVNLIKWELTNREKVGVASETISRHSVTYFDMGKENTSMGFPVSLLGFLKPYRKARFGRGIGR